MSLLLRWHRDGACARRGWGLRPNGQKKRSKTEGSNRSPPPVFVGLNVWSMAYSIWHAMFNDTLLYLYRYLNVINQYMLHVYLIKLFPRPVCFDATWQLYTGTFLRGWPNYRKNMMPWLPCFDVQFFFPCVSLHRVRCCSSFLMLKNMPLLRGKWWFNLGRLQLVNPWQYDKQTNPSSLISISNLGIAMKKTAPQMVVW